LSALLSMFSTARHLELAVAHNLAAELESEQISTAYKSGSFPPAGWVSKAIRQATGELRLLRRSLVVSGLLAAALSAAAIIVAVALGKVHPSFPPDYGKCISAFSMGCVPPIPATSSNLPRHSSARNLACSHRAPTRRGWLCTGGSWHSVVAMRPNPSLHPTAYSGLRPLSSAGELKR
jgi:hypothetical protein